MSDKNKLDRIKQLKAELEELTAQAREEALQQINDLINMFDFRQEEIFPPPRPQKATAKPTRTTYIYINPDNPTQKFKPKLGKEGLGQDEHGNEIPKPDWYIALAKRNDKSKFREECQEPDDIPFK